MERLFLIEDDVDFARKLASGLRKLGYTVGTAEGPATGTTPDRGRILAQAESFRPNCVILDLDVGDGVTEEGKRLLSELRHSSGLAEAYHCVLSVHVSPEGNAGNREMKLLRSEVHQRGADLVLHKEQIMGRAGPDAAKLVAFWPKGDERCVSKPPRVLILEDSKGDIDRYQAALRGRAECLYLSPVKVTPELMEAIRRFDPELIVVDLMLGAETGMKAYPGARIVGAICNDSQLKEKRIIVCSKYINPMEKDPKAPDVPRGAIDKALPKFPFPTADDLLSALHSPNISSPSVAATRKRTHQT